MDPKLIEQFASPSSAFRGKPFWAWNGKLEPGELRRQIRVMHRMGLGGFFMHSRVGLDTPYLSDEWFRCVGACVDEAKKLKMEAWLYDEDRWPSGAAGGLVTKNREFRMRQLNIDVLGKPQDLKWDKGVLAAFVAKIEGAAARGVRRLGRGEAARPAAGESVVAFRAQIHDDSDWYNGQAYLDTLNPAAVREFIRVTHDAYRKRLGKEVGRTVPGIFTDEPNYGEFFGWGGKDMHVPWTNRLPEVFRRRYGYDLSDRLMEIAFDVEGVPVSRARYHFLDCVTHLFVEAFAKQIGEFCEKHKMPHTGHVLCEETLSSQTTVVGSAMRFYEYMQAPGMDILTERRREYDTAKQVSSAARQFGRKWRLTETYGCTGWDFPFSAHKAVGDWQAAFGINLRCQHLSWYTMLGEAKRDYPAGIFYQSPWWEAYPKVEDYFARIHAVMTRGEEVRDLLVIHPIESMWLLCRKDWRSRPEVEALDQMFLELRDTFLKAHLDFDYGEEEVLSRHARVERKGGAAELAVAKARYKAVVVPPQATIRRTTIEILRKFRDAGGLVVFAGDVPKHVDAEPSQAAADLARRCVRAPAKGPQLAAALETTRRVSIADGNGKEIAPALYMLREDAEAFYLFVCNTSLAANQFHSLARSQPMVRDRREAFPDVSVRLLAECNGRPLEFDSDSGAVFAAGAKKAGGGWEIATSLPPIGSRLFVIPKKKQGRLPPARPKLRDVRSLTLAGKAWPVVLSECNNLVLDRPKFRIGDGAWRGPEEVLRVDRAIRESLGVKPRGGGMKQPWAREKPSDPKKAEVSLSYSFDVEAIPSGELFVALEAPQRFAISVNGTPLSMDAECGWWTDLSLRRIPVDPALLRLGPNEIQMACDFDETFSGLEIAYLLGNFGTKVSGTKLAVTDLPRQLRIGDWVGQGLAFYSGNAAYVREIRPKLKKGERLFVQVPEYRGVAVRVTVNGKCAGTIAWEPNEVDITGFLGKGKSELRIEVLGHRRNSHGPHHLNEKWPVWTGPGQFVTSGKQWFDGYQLVPCGLMKPPKLTVRKKA